MDILTTVSILFMSCNVARYVLEDRTLRIQNSYSELCAAHVTVYILHSKGHLVGTQVIAVEVILRDDLAGDAAVIIRTVVHLSYRNVGLTVSVECYRNVVSCCNRSNVIHDGHIGALRSAVAIHIGYRNGHGLCAYI